MAVVRSRLDKFGKIPKALLRSGHVSGNAKALYGLLDEIGDYQEVTIPELAKWMGMADRTVQRTLKELSAVGWLEIQKNEHPTKAKMFLPSTYILNDSAYTQKPLDD